MNYRDTSKEERIARILGIGFDATDGHVRITTAKDFEIHLGSEEGHSRMQEICLEINRRLEEQGRSLSDLTREEFMTLISDIE